MSQPSLEIHVPISPTPRFFDMVRCLAASLRRFGGAYRDAALVVTVGDSNIDPDLEQRLPWLEAAGIEVRWVPEDLFERFSWFATGLERFRYEFTSDVVLILDADLLVCGPFDEMIRRVHRDQTFAGLIAHATPFYADGWWQREAEVWQQLYDRCGLGRLERPHQYTSWRADHESESIRNCRYCPPYFNFGVLCAPGKLMNRLGEVLYPLMRRVDELVTTDFRCQIALSLAITQLSIPYWPLPLRYNFPTAQDLERWYPEEFSEVRLIHLLGRGELDKRTLFASRETLTATVAQRGLTGVEETARRTLAEVLTEL